MSVDMHSPGLANVIAIVVLILAIVFCFIPSAKDFGLILIGALALAILLK